MVEPEPIENRSTSLGPPQAHCAEADNKVHPDGVRVIDFDLGPGIERAWVVRRDCVLNCRHEIYLVNGGCTQMISVIYSTHMWSTGELKNGLYRLGLATHSADGVLEWRASYDGKDYQCEVERTCRCVTTPWRLCRCDSWRPCAK